MWLSNKRKNGFRGKLIRVINIKHKNIYSPQFIKKIRFHFHLFFLSGPIAILNDPI